MHVSEYTNKMKIVDIIIIAILVFNIIVGILDINKSEIEPLIMFSILAFFPLAFVSDYHRANTMLSEGLEKEGYQLLEKHYKILDAGPFAGKIMSSSKVI